MGKIYSCYRIVKNQLGDTDEEYETMYMVLCEKCRDKADAKEKEDKKKVNLFGKYRAAWGKDVARLRDEITTLKEIDAMRMKELAKLRDTVTTKLATTAVDATFEFMDPIMEDNECGPSHSTMLNDNVTKFMEAVNISVDSNVCRNEEEEDTPIPVGELKRKHSEETQVINNKPTESLTIECISCKGRKPLSAFQTKSREKTNSGKSVEYLITRKKCSPCRNTKCNNTKKAKTS